jgi:hypothetical protein
MALVIGKKNTRKIRVNIDEAGDFDNYTRHTADIEFKLLSAEDVKAIEALGQKDNVAFDEDLQVSMIFDTIISVDGLKDETGAALVYGEEVREVLIDTLWTRYPIMGEFWKAQAGALSKKAYKQAQLKN